MGYVFYGIHKRYKNVKYNIKSIIEKYINCIVLNFVTLNVRLYVCNYTQHTTQRMNNFKYG